MRICEALLSGEAALAVVGLGYVGMPLAAAFSDKVRVIGFDTDTAKIVDYKAGIDRTRELGGEALSNAKVEFTDDETRLKEASFFVVAVPTPVTDDNLPDLKYINSACETVGRNIGRGAVVVFESTVYCGVTEDICAPLIEKVSGLRLGADFRIGYSPERINPGDKIHRLDNIVKIVAGMDDNTTDDIAEVYELVVKAGTYKAKSIKAAELAKLEENAQRDINIAFMNELSMVHEKLGVDSMDVINAMNTKWNALGFYPGLVGGHCISVDPYYLIYKAGKEEYHSALASLGREINNGMAAHVADAAIRQMIKADVLIKNARVFVLGVTFKENCPDMRNSLVLKIIGHLKKYGLSPRVADPAADRDELTGRYGIKPVPMGDVRDADCVIFAVAHDEFKALSTAEVNSFFGGKNGVVIDVKNIFRREDIEAQGHCYWCL